MHPKRVLLFFFLNHDNFRQCRYFYESARIYAKAGNNFFINGRLIIVSCTYSLQHCFLLHNKKENDNRILCSCKIFGWECVGDSIPVKPAIPYLHVASFHTFHFVDLIFSCSKLLLLRCIFCITENFETKRKLSADRVLWGIKR